MFRKLALTFLALLVPLVSSAQLVPRINGDSTSFVLSAATEATNTMTFTTGAVAHGLIAGQSFTVQGVTPAGYNGTWRAVTVPSTTTVTATNLTAGLGAGSVFGTLTTPGLPPTGLVTTVSGLTVQVASGPVYCNGSTNHISKTNLTLPASSSVTIFYRCPTDEVIASASAFALTPAVDVLLDVTVTGASTITSNTDARISINYPPIQDFVWWVPFQSCGMTLTTGALGASTIAQNPGLANAAANNQILQVITSAAASAMTLDCDLLPPNKSTAGHGVSFDSGNIYYGYQGAAALSSIAGPTFSSVTYISPGGTPQGTVAAAGGTIVQIAGTSHSSPGAVTTTGQCYSENFMFTTPLVLTVNLAKLTLEEVFNHTTASAATYQLCGVEMFGSYVPL